MNKLILTVTLAVTLAANGAYALRCGGQIVTTGDSTASVIEKCGIPDSGYSDHYGDNQSVTYKNDAGAEETVTILNGQVTDVEMKRL